MLGVKFENSQNRREETYSKERERKISLQFSHAASC